MGGNFMDEHRFYVDEKTYPRIAKAIAKVKADERAKIVDAFMSGLESELVAILKDDKGNYFYKCPDEGTLKPIPPEAVAGVLQAARKQCSPS